MTGSLGPPPVAPPAGTRSSQTGAPAAPVPGFLSVNGERIESTNALVDRLGTPGLKVVEAYSESWGPCGSVAPLMRKFILEVAPPAKALQVLVCKAEGNTLLEKFRNTSVPHFLFFRDGHLRDTVVGPNIPALERVLRQHIPKPEDPVVDPTSNRYYKPPPTPSSRPMTAGRPRTADLLRAGRPASRAAPPPMEGLLETTPPADGPRLSGTEAPPPPPPGSRPSSAVPRPSASGAPRPSASGAVPRPSAGPGLTLDLSAIGDRPASAAADGERPSSAVPRASAAGGAEAPAAEGEDAADAPAAAEGEAAPEAPAEDAPAEPAAAEAPAADAPAASEEPAAPEAAAPAAEEEAAPAAAPEAAEAPAAEEPAAPAADASA